VIAALKKGHTTEDCRKIAKRFKVKESYVQYVRKTFAKDVGYKPRAPRTGKGKRVVTLDIKPTKGRHAKPKRGAVARPTGMRGAAVKMLVDHGNELPAQERSLYRAALDLVLTKGE
jgi:hypothetical protein